jgi:hypothetical protein
LKESGMQSVIIKTSLSCWNYIFIENFTREMNVPLQNIKIVMQKERNRMKTKNNGERI